MCEFCIQHGEGKKWYLQAKNYSAELLNEERILYISEFAKHIERWVVDWGREIDVAQTAGPSAKSKIRSRLMEKAKKEHFGQVVPLEEAECILDTTVSVVRMACVCRSVILGRYDARYCLGITTCMPDLRVVYDLYPDFSADLEVMSREEAKELVREHDHDGLVHTVWTFLTPYIGAICNCTSNDCLPLRMRLRYGIPMLFKGEYIARIDWESCAGCRECMLQCNFGAIGYSAAVDKCYINAYQCYGCGVCRAVCPNDAITLTDRNTIPVLAGEW